MKRSFCLRAETSCFPHVTLVKEDMVSNLCQAYITEEQKKKDLQRLPSKSICDPLEDTS